MQINGTLQGSARTYLTHIFGRGLDDERYVVGRFAELTRKQLQRGVHTSTRQLEADIRAFIEKHNEDPKPFRWTKSADDILAAVKRFCLRVDQNLCHEL